MNKIIIGILATCSIVFGSTDSNDTTCPNNNIDGLQLSIDSLNAKVNRLLIENKADNNPLATGSYKDWGTKFYGDLLLTLDAPEIEIGFMKKLGEFRYGTGIGYKNFYNRNRFEFGAGLAMESWNRHRS